jgi:hypothetical protein
MQLATRLPSSQIPFAIQFPGQFLEAGGLVPTTASHGTTSRQAPLSYRIDSGVIQFKLQFGKLALFKARWASVGNAERNVDLHHQFGGAILSSGRTQRRDLIKPEMAVRLFGPLRGKTPR